MCIIYILLFHGWSIIDLSGGDREQAALQDAGAGGGTGVAHPAAGGGLQGGAARGLVGRQAAQEQAHRRVPAPGEDGGGRAPGRHNDHPRAHGLRKGPTNDPIVLFICQQIIYCMYIMRVQWSSTLLH